VYNSDKGRWKIILCNKDRIVSIKEENIQRVMKMDGIVKDPSLNGKIVALEQFNEEKKRWLVSILRTTRKLMVKASNLVICTKDDLPKKVDDPVKLMQNTMKVFQSPFMHKNPIVQQKLQEKGLNLDKVCSFLQEMTLNAPNENMPAELQNTFSTAAQMIEGASNAFNSVSSEDAENYREWDDPKRAEFASKLPPDYFANMFPMFTKCFQSLPGEDSSKDAVVSIYKALEPIGVRVQQEVDELIKKYNDENMAWLLE